MSTSAFSDVNFRIYFTGSLFSLLGSWIQRLALGWYTWELTQSEFWVGAIAFLLFIPVVFVAPIFGVYSDRLNLQKTTVVINCILMTMAFTTFGLIWLDMMTIGLLCIFAASIGGVSSAYQPIRLTIVPALVSRPLMGGAIAWSSIAFNISRFVGPAIAGVIISTWGVSFAFFVNALTYIPFIIAVSIIQLRSDKLSAPTRAPLGVEFVQGLKYIRAHSAVAQLLILAAISGMLARGLFELLPAYAALIFGGDSGMLAILTSAGGVGAIAAGLVLARAGEASHLSDVAQWATFAAGLLMCVVVVPMPLWLGVFLITVLSFCNTLTGVGIQSAMQYGLDDGYRGRVMSLWSAVAFGGLAIGSIIMGAASGWLGIVPTTVIWGLACSACVSVLILKARSTA